MTRSKSNASTHTIPLSKQHSRSSSINKVPVTSDSIYRWHFNGGEEEEEKKIKRRKKERAKEETGIEGRKLSK